MSIKNEGSILQFPSGTYSGVQVLANGVLRISPDSKKRKAKKIVKQVQKSNADRENNS